MRADMLARFRAIARGDCAKPASFDGVTNSDGYARKSVELRRSRGLRPNGDERESKTGEVVKRAARVPLDAAEIEERAGLAADRVPRIYLDAWARLNCQKPASVLEAEWRLALDDGGRFLDRWGNEAAEWGWTPGDIFDLSTGLVWRLAGRRVGALGLDEMHLSDGRIITRSK